MAMRSSGANLANPISATGAYGAEPSLGVPARMPTAYMSAPGDARIFDYPSVLTATDSLREHFTTLVLQGLAPDQESFLNRIQTTTTDNLMVVLQTIHALPSVMQDFPEEFMPNVTKTATELAVAWLSRGAIETRLSLEAFQIQPAMMQRALEVQANAVRTSIRQMVLGQAVTELQAGFARNAVAAAKRTRGRAVPTLSALLQSEIDEFWRPHKSVFGYEQMIDAAMALIKGRGDERSPDYVLVPAGLRTQLHERTQRHEYKQAGKDAIQHLMGGQASYEMIMGLPVEEAGSIYDKQFPAPIDLLASRVVVGEYHCSRAETLLEDRDIGVYDGEASSWTRMSPEFLLARSQRFNNESRTHRAHGPLCAWLNALVHGVPDPQIGRIYKNNATAEMTARAWVREQHRTGAAKKIDPLIDFVPLQGGYVETAIADGYLAAGGQFEILFGGNPAYLAAEVARAEVLAARAALLAPNVGDAERLRYRRALINMITEVFNVYSETGVTEPLTQLRTDMQGFFFPHTLETWLDTFKLGLVGGLIFPKPPGAAAGGGGAGIVVPVDAAAVRAVRLQLWQMILARALTQMRLPPASVEPVKKRMDEAMKFEGIVDEHGDPVDVVYAATYLHPELIANFGNALGAINGPVDAADNARVIDDLMAAIDEFAEIVMDSYNDDVEAALQQKMAAAPYRQIGAGNAQQAQQADAAALTAAADRLARWIYQIAYLSRIWAGYQANTADNLLDMMAVFRKAAVAARGQPAFVQTLYYEVAFKLFTTAANRNDEYDVIAATYLGPQNANANAVAARDDTEAIRVLVTAAQAPDRPAIEAVGAGDETTVFWLQFWDAQPQNATNAQRSTVIAAAIGNDQLRAAAILHRAIAAVLPGGVVAYVDRRTTETEIRQRVYVATRGLFDRDGIAAVFLGLATVPDVTIDIIDTLRPQYATIGNYAEQVVFGVPYPDLATLVANEAGALPALPEFNPAKDEVAAGGAIGRIRVDIAALPGNAAPNATNAVFLVSDRINAAASRVHWRLIRAIRARFPGAGQPNVALRTAMLNFLDARRMLTIDQRTLNAYAVEHPGPVPPQPGAAGPVIGADLEETCANIMAALKRRQNGPHTFPFDLIVARPNITVTARAAVVARNDALQNFRTPGFQLKSRDGGTNIEGTTYSIFTASLLVRPQSVQVYHHAFTGSGGTDGASEPGYFGGAGTDFWGSPEAFRADERGSCLAFLGFAGHRGDAFPIDGFLSRAVFSGVLSDSRLFAEPLYSGALYYNMLFGFDTKRDVTLDAWTSMSRFRQWKLMEGHIMHPGTTVHYRREAPELRTLMFPQEKEKYLREHVGVKRLGPIVEKGNSPLGMMQCGCEEVWRGHQFLLDSQFAQRNFDCFTVAR